MLDPERWAWQQYVREAEEAIMLDARNGVHPSRSISRTHFIARLRAYNGYLDDLVKREGYADA